VTLLFKVCLVIANLSMNVLLINSMKYVFVHFHYEYPLFVTSTHMIFSYIVAAMFIHVLKIEKNHVVLSWWDHLTKIIPLSCVAATSIACGNMALKYLYPSFNEMIQTTSPLATVVVAYIMTSNRYNYWGLMSLFPVCFGCIFCIEGEINFSLLGTFFGFAAVFLRGIKNVVQASLLRDQQPPVPASSLLYYQAPYAFCIYIGASLAVEGLTPIKILANYQENWKLILGVSATGLIACTFNLMTFTVIKYLDAVGAVVVGNVKVPVIFLISYLLFGSSVTLPQLFGSVIAMSGVYIFNKYGTTCDSETIKRCFWLTKEQIAEFKANKETLPLVKGKE